MSDVFISYAKEDAAAARKVADALQKAEFSVWWDHHIPPGKTWDDVIGRALDSAACVIVLWSKTSVQSRYVREEAERAVSRGRLIPVFVEKVDPPFGFGRIQAADLEGWHGDEQDPEFVNLLAAVSDLVRTAPANESTPEPAPPAPSPRPPRRTLRGYLWLAGAIVLAVVSYAAWTKFRPPPSALLPNVVGLPLADARRLLESSGFARIVEDHIVSGTHPPGTVVEQDPLSGKALPAETTVRLVLATKPPAEPRPAPVRRLPAPPQVGPPSGAVLSESTRSVTVVWNGVAKARSYSVEHAFLEPGQHCSAVTRANRKVPDITETRYTFRFGGTQPGCWRVWAVDEQGNEGAKSPWWGFSFGRPSAVVPNVVGLPVAEAKQRLQSTGFTKIVQGRRVSDAPVGTVLEQNPAAGATLPLDSPIRLTQAVESAPWASRRYEGFWRNVSPAGGFLQFLEIQAAAPREVRIRAWLRCQPTPAQGGGLQNCRQWTPVPAAVEPNRVHWTYPGDNVGENILTWDGPRLVIETVKTGWKNSFERADRETIPR